MKIYRRFSRIERSAVDMEARTVALSFSSETPYERSFGAEILDHAPSSIRLDRLNDGGAVLLDHDTTRLVGVVESARVDGDRVGRAVVRFGKSPEAQAAFADVEDGIRSHISVGYYIHEAKERKANDRREYVVVDWEPVEISFVAVPADPSVGVGRSADDDMSLADIESVLTRDASTQIAIVKEEPAMSEVNSDISRRNAIVALGESFKSYVSERDVIAALNAETSVESFKDSIMAKMATKHVDATDASVRLSANEVNAYSLSRAIVASITGDWRNAGFEREISAAIEQRTGKAPEGFYVPPEAWGKRDFTAGTAAEAGNLVATSLATDLFTDALRAKLVMAGLGIRVLTGVTGNISVPRKSSATTAYGVAETAALTESNPATALVSLTPKRKGGFVEYSKQALIQSGIALEPMLRDDLLMSTAIMIENEMINGSGTAPAMRGIRNTSGIGSVAGGTNGAALTWGHVVGLESACASANAEPDLTAGYLTNTKVRGTMKQTLKAANVSPFIWAEGAAPVNSYRCAITNNVLSNLTKGTGTNLSSVIFSSDWRMAVLAMFGAPDITVDPYSLATTGLVRITLNQYADFGIRQPGAFATMDDAITA